MQILRPKVRQTFCLFERVKACGKIEKTATTSQSACLIVFLLFFLTHNLADLLKLARKMGALIQEPYHSGPHTKTMILLAVQPIILLASKQHFHPLLAGQLGDVVARRHRLLALVASFGVLQTSPPIINTPGAKK